jgi:hypothetical protein
MICFGCGANGLDVLREPPPTHYVNRDSGTASANGDWLRQLVSQEKKNTNKKSSNASTRLPPPSASLSFQSNDLYRLFLRSKVEPQNVVHHLHWFDLKSAFSL